VGGAPAPPEGPPVKVPPLGMSADEVRRELEPLRRPLRVALLRTGNPFNVGAIIRTAHSFLVREILLVGCERWYERAAMGMQRFENLVELPDEAALVARARAQGLPLVVLEKDDASESLWTAPLPDECILVFGSEHHGVGSEVVAAAAQVLAIPMYGVNHSLPVAVAAGIAMAEWTRRYTGAQPRHG